MRLTALALVAALAVAGCGGDEPEETDTPATNPQPAPTRPAADTALGDTTAMSDANGATGAPGQTRRTAGQAGSQAGPTASPGTAGGARTGGAAASSSQRLYTIQVAAFNEPATAQEWERRLRSQGLPVWTSMAELGGRTFYRVRVGALPTVGEARRFGTMISERYEWPVWVAPVTPADRPPQNAVEQTRGALRGG